MKFRGLPYFLVLLVLLVVQATDAFAQSSSSVSHPSQNTQSVGHPHPDSSLDAGTVTNGVYRNKTLGFTCKIPPGWVLRTEEMNAQETKDESSPEDGANLHPPAKSATGAEQPNPSRGGRVLLAAFSRPPEALGEEVNASIVIAAESVEAYPGLKEAVQYFEPLTEVAKAQGFTVDEEPYEIAIGAKVLVREDFHKDVGTRVMRQSTMAMLARGHAVSFTVIAGTEDDVEELIDGLDFEAGKPPAK